MYWHLINLNHTNLLDVLYVVKRHVLLHTLYRQFFIVGLHISVCIVSFVAQSCMPDENDVLVQRRTDLSCGITAIMLSTAWNAKSIAIFVTLLLESCLKHSRAAAIISFAAHAQGLAVFGLSTTASRSPFRIVSRSRSTRT